MTKRNGRVVTLLLVAVVIVSCLVASQIEYWSPVRFDVVLSAIPDGDNGGSGTTTLAQSLKISYETWQDWHIHLQSGYTDRYQSARKTFGFTYELKTVVGRFYYAWIDIPMVQYGTLPESGQIGTQSYWYLQDEVYGTAQVYLQDLSHYVGSADLVPIRFGPRDASGTSKSLRLYIGTHDGVRYVKANYQVGTSEAVDIESYLTAQGLAGAKQFTVLVVYKVQVVTYKIKPFLPGGIGESIQVVKETTSPNVPGQVAFSLPESWTGTYSTGTTFQTITKIQGGTDTVTRTIIIPSTVVLIQPTTICGTSGVCVTFTGVSTVFSGWTTTETITVQSPIIVLPDWLKGIADFLNDPFAWLKGTTNIVGLEVPNWLILVGVLIGVAIILWLLFKLLR